MHRRVTLVITVVTAAVLACVSWPQAVAAPAAKPGGEVAAPARPTPGSVVVLDTTGFWRMYHELKPPLVQQDEGLKPMLMGLIYLETALTDKVLRAKLGDDLAGRIKATLDERIRYIWKSNGPHYFQRYAWGYPQPWGDGGHSGHTWFLSTGWQVGSEKLYDLATEVQRRLAAK